MNFFFFAETLLLCVCGFKARICFKIFEIAVLLEFYAGLKVSVRI